MSKQIFILCLFDRSKRKPLTQQTEIMRAFVTACSQTYRPLDSGLWGRGGRLTPIFTEQLKLAYKYFKRTLFNVVT